VLLYECPKKLRELLHKEEIPPPGQCPVLVFDLVGGKQVILTQLLLPDMSVEFDVCDIQALTDVRSVIEMRMIEHETVRLEGNKYSGQQTPPKTDSLLTNCRRVVLQ
jgi:hypothetical protein